MSILDNTKNEFPLIGKYIPTEQRQKHFLVIVIIFVIAEVIQTISFIFLRLSILHCISLIPIVLSGWLLGLYVPVFIGLLSNYIMGIVIGISGAGNLNPPFQLLTIAMIFLGTGIGLISDILSKSRLLSKNLSEEELRDNYSQKFRFWGRYLTVEKRNKRLLLFITIFIIYLIIQMLVFLNVRKGIILSLNFIPIAISGWLLGIYGPILTGLLTDFFVVIVMRITGFQNTESLFGIVQMLISVLIGCVIGKLSELIDKSRITEEEIKKSKEEAERANRAKSEFLACMSHEIRTPINSIMGFAQLLKEEVKQPSHVDKIDIILKSGKTLLTLIDDILDLSKIEAGEMEIIEEEFSLRNILIPLQNVFLTKAQEKKLKFSISIDTSVPEALYGDEHRIQQIVSNLINNAIKFTEKGSINISADYIDGELCISVEDTGIGIPEEMHEAIFTVFKRGDPSLTRAYSGTGLGLAITKQLVEQMNGSITVNSLPAQGSCFTVKLPLKIIEKSRDKLMSNSAANQEYTAKAVLFFLEKGISCNILVAEDNESNRLYLHELLVRAGLYCDFAKDGRETIEMLEKKVDTDDWYDLLILDIQMPVMSGIDVITYIRESERLKDIYCIAVTAHALKGDEKKYLDAGCDDYLAKPIENHKLYKQIIRQLEKKSNQSLHFESQEKKSGAMYAHNTPYTQNRKSATADNTPYTQNRKSATADNMNVESIENKNKDEVRKLIIKFKDNYKLYNKQELLVLQKECKSILPKKMSTFVDSKIQNSIKAYDDEMLLEIIELLESVLGETPGEVPAE
ncbi:MAG: response regulator [Spirochaetales bacterium]|nr:response regulator [Spirochaetales bacterium]